MSSLRERRPTFLRAYPDSICRPNQENHGLDGGIGRRVEDHLAVMLQVTRRHDTNRRMALPPALPYPRSSGGNSQWLSTKTRSRQVATWTKRIGEDVDVIPGLRRW